MYVSKMYSHHLKPKIDIKCDEEFDVLDIEDSICNICESECKKIYSTTIYDEKITIKTCYLCNIVCNFKGCHIGKAFLVKSKLSQQEINKTTLKYFYENGFVPKPQDVDADCEIIRKSIYASIYNNECDNYKIMFTNELSKSLINNNPFVKNKTFIKKNK